MERLGGRFGVESANDQEQLFESSGNCAGISYPEDILSLAGLFLLPSTLFTKPTSLRFEDQIEPFPLSFRPHRSGKICFIFNLVLLWKSR